MVLIDVATINPFDNSHARDVFDAGSDRRIPAFLRTGKTAQEVRTHREYLSASIRHELNRCGSTVIRADSSERMFREFVRMVSASPISLHTQSAQSTVLTHLGRQSMNHIALSRNDFNTLDPIHIETGLGIVVAVCLILAVALVVLVVWLSKPTLKPTKKTNRGRHDASTGTSYGMNASTMWWTVMPTAISEERKRSPCSHRSPEISSPRPPAATCAIRRSPILKRHLARPATSMGCTLLRQTIEHCIRRNSRMPNAITRPERPRLNRLESGLPILWKGGDEWNCHGTGRG